MGIFHNIQENYIFSKDDKYIRFNEWKPEKNKNILLITGLSASGKSTLASNLSKKYKAIAIELDLVYCSKLLKYKDSELTKGKKIIKLFLEKNKNRIPSIGSSDSDIKKEKIYFSAFMNFFKNYASNNSNQLFILEGVQLFIYDIPGINNYPIIIKNTSMLKSMYQRLKREEYPNPIKYYDLKYIKYYFDDEKLMAKFRKGIKESDILINENSNIFTEASRKVSKTKYKCPFCNYHATKDKLVTHIEKVHSDMIPKGYTGARVLFNEFNHKDHGNCIICGRETKWNESTWRYERLCGRKICHDKYVKQMQDNMLKKYGKKNLLGDPEHQKKMLSHRSISGRYKFKDGHYKEYVGSYEKKLLEFLDKVLEIKSQDIYSPGPVIDYEYNGEKHSYISDFFYDPFNLIIEVKDGGNNPNTRDMKSYREKQLAKENAIKKLNKYNYIRLTNNDFQQLILTMLKIKEQLSDNPNPTEAIIDINEVGVAGAPVAGAMPRGNTPEAYIVPCFMNNIYSGSIISTDKFLKNIYRVQDDEIKKDNLNYLYNYDYDIYKIVKNNDKISDIINNKGKLESKKDYLYSAITGKDLLDPKQFEYEECFEKVEDPYLDKWNKIVNISESIRYQFNILNNHNFDMNIVNEQVISKKKEKLSNHKKVDIRQDINGYFLCNTVTNCRTKSYKNIESIPESQYNNIENMKL